MMSVGIEDVARQAGVSIATVSRVLADKPHVSSKTRQLVLDAVRQLGYRPNRAARSLRSQTSKRLGLIISDIQNPFFTAMVRAVEDVAYKHEYTLILCNTGEDAEREALNLDLMVSEQVAGVILSPTTANSSETIRQLTEVGIPVVLVDRSLADPAFDSVLVENVQSTSQLIDHLIENGHTRIGAVIGTAEASTGRERQRGYEKALTQAGLPIDTELLLTGLPKAETGYKLTKRLLHLAAPPTALFTGNNLLTLGALRAIHEHGVSIPDEIAVVAYDEMDWMFVMQPPLTVVAQPVYEMGKQAAELMLERIRNPEMPPVHTVLEPTILLRGSSDIVLQPVS